MASIYTCCTCTAQYEAQQGGEPPSCCRICADERQYVPSDGQRWTMSDELIAQGFRNKAIAVEPGVHAIAVEPKLGIGQQVRTAASGVDRQCRKQVAEGRRRCRRRRRLQPHGKQVCSCPWPPLFGPCRHTSGSRAPASHSSLQAYLVHTPQGNIMWDCVGLLHPQFVAEVGGAPSAAVRQAARQRARNAGSQHLPPDVVPPSDTCRRARAPAGGTPQPRMPSLALSLCGPTTGCDSPRLACTCTQVEALGGVAGGCLAKATFVLKCDSVFHLAGYYSNHVVLP